MRLYFLVIVLAFTYINCESSYSQQKDSFYLFKDKYIKQKTKKVVDWQLDNPKYQSTSWHNAAFYAGVFSTWEITRSKKIYRALMDMGAKNNWSPGRRWYHADDFAICQTYIDLYRREKDPQMLLAFIDTLDIFMKNSYPSTLGFDRIKWWWSDALFMGPPALVKLGMTLKENLYLELNDQHFNECYELLYDQDEKLFARDSRYVIKGDENDLREANGAKVFWSRGNGWVLAGLVRILDELPADYPKRPFYEELFKEMSSRLASLQQSDGLWRASLLDPLSFPGGEVSGTGFICYGLAWGINNELLEKEKYLSVVENAWIGLNRCVSDNGKVGWVQPVGFSPNSGFGADSWELYGTGAFLLAASEVINL